MEFMKDRPKLLMATVYLKSQTGRSLLQEKPAAPSDPVPYLPSPETIKKAIAELTRLGFTIEAQGATLSVSAPPELFEQVCGVKISFEETTEYDPQQGRTMKRRVYRSSRPVMQIQGLDDIIEGMTFAVPGRPFDDHKP